MVDAAQVETSMFKGTEATLADAHTTFETLDSMCQAPLGSASHEDHAPMSM